MLESFLEGTFESSPLYAHRAVDRRLLARAAVGGAISIAGIALAYYCYVRRPGVTVRLAERLRAPARVPAQQVVLRRARSTRSSTGPTIAIGRFANSVFERVVVQGIVTAATGRRARARARSSAAPSRASCAPTRCCWSAGSRRSGIYFLVVSELMLNVLLWAPLAAGRWSRSSRRARLSRWAGVLGRAGGARARDRAGRRLRLRRRRAAARRRRVLDPGPRRPLPARRRRDQRLPGPADGRALVRGDAVVGAARRPGDGRERLYYFLLGLAETAALGAFLAQDLLLFVLFFDLMLIPFFFLIGTFGGRERIAATTKMIVYTLVGSLLMLVGAIATAILASGSVGELSFSIPVLQRAPALDRQPGVDLLLLRRRLPGQDAGLPDPRLDARRLPRRAAAGADPALGRALEGRRLRLPAGRAAAVPDATVALPGARDADRASPRSSTAR